MYELIRQKKKLLLKRKEYIFIATQAMLFRPREADLLNFIFDGEFDAAEAGPLVL